MIWNISIYYISQIIYYIAIVFIFVFIFISHLWGTRSDTSSKGMFSIFAEKQKLRCCCLKILSNAEFKKNIFKKISFLKSALLNGFFNQINNIINHINYLVKNAVQKGRFQKWDFFEYIFWIYFLKFCIWQDIQAAATKLLFCSKYGRHPFMG